MARMTPEGKVKRSIIKALNGFPEGSVYFEARQAGGFSYKHGLPDIFCVYKGRHIEIEVKRPGGRPRADQIKWRHRLEACGAMYILAESDQDVTEALSTV